MRICWSSTRWHGRWDADITSDAESISIDGVRLPVLNERDPAKLPLGGVDVVIDCTGVFKTAAKDPALFRRGREAGGESARRSRTGGAANIVYGVNHDIYDPAQHRIVTGGQLHDQTALPRW